MIRTHDNLHSMNERVVLVVCARVPTRKDTQLGVVDGSVEKNETVHETGDGEVGKHAENTKRGEVLGAVDEPREDVENDRTLQTLNVKRRREDYFQSAFKSRFERRVARLHVLSERAVD